MRLSRGLGSELSSLWLLSSSWLSVGCHFLPSTIQASPRPPVCPQPAGSGPARPVLSFMVIPSPPRLQQGLRDLWEGGREH